MRVLIIDDSVVYRSKIRAALTGIDWLEVVGVASNGKIALEMMGQKAVDLITLDMEMPTMDGLQTLRELRSKDKKTKVIVFSSCTIRGSESTLEALASGADDFVTKPDAGVSSSLSPEEIIKRELLPKIKQFYKGDEHTALEEVKPNAEPRQPTSNPQFTRKDLDTFVPDAIVIASSTGGPSAHDQLFSGMNGSLRCPILIVQHMPPVFTTSFAKRISENSGLPCKEAVRGEEVKNEIYVAPGDFHLTVREENGKIVTMLDKLPQQNSVRPAADCLFESASKVYGQKCMGIILTGMGEDGLQGAKAVKSKMGGIMIQNEASCVVFGMPGAVFAAGSYDGVGSLEEIRKRVKRMALR
jgi:two-component system chemotaxis response regulator CheB